MTGEESQNVNSVLFFMRLHMLNCNQHMLNCNLHMLNCNQLKIVQ